MTHAMHYHTWSNVAGYSPEPDDAGTFATLGDTLSALADELARYADELYERLDAFALPEDRTGDEDAETAAEVEEEGDRVHAIATALSTYADELRNHESGETAYQPSALTLDGESYPTELVRSGGLSVGVNDPERLHDLGRNYRALPCDEPGTCELYAAAVEDGLVDEDAAAL